MLTCVCFCGFCNNFNQISFKYLFLECRKLLAIEVGFHALEQNLVQKWFS